MQGAGSRIQGAGSRVQGAGCRVQGAGCRVQSSECRAQPSGFRVHGSWFMVHGSGFRIEDSGYRVQGLVFQGRAQRSKCSRLGAAETEREIRREESLGRVKGGDESHNEEATKRYFVEF